VIEPLPSPPSVHLVENADAVVAAVGRFDLRGAELRAARLGLAPGDVPTLELELRLRDGAAGDAAADGDTGEHALGYRVTLRCTDIADLGLADFEHRNVVESYAFVPLGAEVSDGREVRVSVIGVMGCDLELRCASVAVVDVAPASRRWRE
jgi:hypothetical protein